jgi:predicted acylesterase/phospholipase RssA
MSIGMEPEPAAPGARAPAPPPDPPRLGLALSGGGFRATLFHLGVLTRLAELDLLRHLNMISAVSGGSVLAAHYMLLLKHALEKDGTGRLSNRRYRAIMRCIRRQLRIALAHDPRNSILVDFGATARVRSLSQRMVQQYQRFLYASGTTALRLPDPRARDEGPRLFDLRVRLPEIERTDDLVRFNGNRGRDCVPQLVLNAATLNTASRFTFTFTEIGDEVLGYVRFDERDLLARYRRIVDAWKPGDDEGRPAEEVLALVDDEVRLANARHDPDVEPFRRRPFLIDHLAWFDLANRDRDVHASHPDQEARSIAASPPQRVNRMLSLVSGEKSIAVEALLANRDCGPRFLGAPFAVLRAAKVSAWYLLHKGPWFSDDVALEHGGLTYAQHHARVRAAIREVDQDLAEMALPEEVATPPATQRQRAWYEFVLELYYLRLCRVIRADAAIEVRLPTAVQSSANFPPVFGALNLDGIFDKDRVHKLQLSDGGLNDNNGIEALFEGRCTHIIASEAGPRPAIKSPVNWNRLGLVGQIMINQLPIVRRLLMRTLREEQRVHEALASLPGNRGCVTRKLEDLVGRYPVERVAFFDMDTSLSAGVDPEIEPKPLPAHPLARTISKLRTDLDAFNDIEQQALLYQGYQYADRFVRRYLYEHLKGPLELKSQAAPVRDHWPLPKEAQWDHVRLVLEAGASLTRRARGISGFGHRTCATAYWLVIGVPIALVLLIEWARISLLARITEGAPWWWMATIGALLWIPAVLLWLLTSYCLFLVWLRFDAWLAARAAVAPKR